MATFLPTAFYTGFSVDNTKAFMTSITEDKSYEQRKMTVDSWRCHVIPPKEVSNNPVEGFKIKGLDRRYRTDNVVWLIAHPEGFQFEITSENLKELLHKVTVVNGEFKTPLVFVTKASRNWLTYVGSDIYKEALPVSLLAQSKRIGVRDLECGYKVLLSTGEYHYAGRYYIRSEPEGDIKRVFLFIKYLENGGVSITTYASLPKILLITEKNKVSESRSYQTLVNYLTDGSYVGLERYEPIFGIFHSKPEKECKILCSQLSEDSRASLKLSRISDNRSTTTYAVDFNNVYYRINYLKPADDCVRVRQCTLGSDSDSNFKVMHKDIRVEEIAAFYSYLEVDVDFEPLGSLKG